jgi:hypothetical protein
MCYGQGDGRSECVIGCSIALLHCIACLLGYADVKVDPNHSMHAPKHCYDTDLILLYSMERGSDVYELIVRTMFTNYHSINALRKVSHTTMYSHVWRTFGINDGAYYQQGIPSYRCRYQTGRKQHALAWPLSLIAHCDNSS